MKNLITGPLGKITSETGSRLFTTPNTIEFSGSLYDINTRVQGEFVTHSLDGRLWLYRQETRYGILALRFNAETEKLEFATSRTITFTNERILARGLDWILTSKNIYMASDEEPYIFSANLYDNNLPDRFLYSILRSNNVSDSRIDPFTKEAWGKSVTNGNSDGTGYFSKNTELLKPAGSFILDKSYAILPSIGNWQILPNYLLRRPSSPLSESYNGQINLRPLIPLEFNKGGKSSYGCGYNHDISLACINGELWGRGYLHIGKVKILPAVFDESSEVLEYYLYISPEYPCSPFNPTKEEPEQYKYHYFEGNSYKVVALNVSYEDWMENYYNKGLPLFTQGSTEEHKFVFNYIPNDSFIWRSDNTQIGCNPYIIYTLSGNLSSVTGAVVYKYNEIKQNPGEGDGENDQWLKLKLSQFGGYFSGQSNSLDNSLCEVNEDTRIFNLASQDITEQIPEGSTGKFYVDLINSSGLILHDKGAKFIGGDEYECKALSQWLAPSGQIESISSGSVVSSFDGALLNTTIPTGFNRQLLRANNPVMTAKNYSGSQLILDEYVSSSRKSFHVNKFVSQLEKDLKIAWESVYKSPVKISLVNILENVKFYDYADTLLYPLYLASKKICHYNLYDWYPTDPAESVITSGGAPGGMDSDGNWLGVGIQTSVNSNLFYINPETGEKSENFTLFAPAFSSDNGEYWTMRESVHLVDAFNNMLGYYVTRFRYRGGSHYSDWEDEFFRPVMPIPSAIKNWVHIYDFMRNNKTYPFDDYWQEDLTIQQAMWSDESIGLSNVSFSSSYVEFREKSTQTKFFMKLPFSSLKNNFGIGIRSFANIEKYDSDYTNRKKWLKISHIIDITTGLCDPYDDGECNTHTFITIHTEYDPDEFDFDAELIRSEKI